MIWIIWLVSLLVATAIAAAYVGHIYADARRTLASITISTEAF